MPKKKLFSTTSGCRSAKPRRKIETHDYDVTYGHPMSDRIKNKEFVDFDLVVMSDETKVMSNACIIRKASEISMIPEGVIQAITLDLIDLITLAVSKGKSVSFNGFGHFVLDEDSKLKFVQSDSLTPIIDSLKDKEIKNG